MRIVGPVMILISAVIAGCSGNGGEEAAGGTDGTTGTGTAGNDTPAECSPDAPCGAGEACDYPDGLCGAGRKGTCYKPSEIVCGGPELPACGCDGKVHDDSCAAMLEGIEMASQGCSAPGMVQCETAMCDIATSYCRKTPISDQDVLGFCSPFKRDCAADCSCIQEHDAACACTGDAETGVVVDCTG